ncbi:MAG: peptidoglycan DD-metalloendopeptidase family protein [Gammaproteobacteria bacterium]
MIKPGDTLYSIAWRYGLDYHDVAVWNSVSSDYLIKPGQTLVLAASVRTIAAPTVKPVMPTRVASTAPSPAAASDSLPPAGLLRWVWPTRGGLVRMFHADDPLSKGIDISGVQGQGIYAAASGKVVYTGSAIIGYGKLIIIKNSEQFLSAYADNDEILVKEGDTVKAGDSIATMGLNRDGHPLLHFEIRYNGKPVNPLSYLPRQ